MKRIPWELLLVLSLLTGVAVAAQELAPKPSGDNMPLASDSAAPSGSRAAFLWLQSVGYKVQRLENARFRPDDAVEVLLILAPSTPPKRDHLSVLHRWVEKGGTLIVVGNPAPAIPAMPFGGSPAKGSTLSAFLGEFGLKLQTLGAQKQEITPSQPLLLHPVVNRVRVDANSFITGSANLIPYLGEPERPVAAGLAVGAGRVYVLASDYAFSNEGIGQLGNAGLLLNWLPATGPSDTGAIAFDEVHHGRAEDRSFFYDLLHEPWGWATLYGAGAIFLYLLLGGRRFGRPVPVVVDWRRPASEYVVSLAGLLRRGGKSAWVARHYELMLRRQLAVAAGLDPSLDTAAVASRLEEMGRLATGVDVRDACRALRGLHEGARTGVNEGKLIRLAAEADRIMKGCAGRGP